MKIARVEALPMYPKVVKEAWTEDEYVWPSRPPSFLIRVTAENGEYGVGEVTSQVWYLGETEAHIAACELPEDRAASHGRLAQFYAARGARAKAKQHRERAQDEWRTHAANQRRLVDLLASIEASAPASQ